MLQRNPNWEMETKTLTRLEIIKPNARKPTLAKITVQNIPSNKTAKVIKQKILEKSTCSVLLSISICLLISCSAELDSQNNRKVTIKNPVGTISNQFNPTLIAFSPQDALKHVLTDQDLVFIFSEEMDTKTLRVDFSPSSSTISSCSGTLQLSSDDFQSWGS